MLESEENELVSPCGMNCSICANYLALKNQLRNKGVKMAFCQGCRPRNKNCAFLKKVLYSTIREKIGFLF